jgi:hypothetical protein
MASEKDEKSFFIKHKLKNAARHYIRSNLAEAAPFAKM